MTRPAWMADSPTIPTRIRIAINCASVSLEGPSRSNCSRGRSCSGESLICSPKTCRSIQWSAETVEFRTHRYRSCLSISTRFNSPSRVRRLMTRVTYPGLESWHFSLAPSAENSSKSRIAYRMDFSFSLRSSLTAGSFKKWDRSTELFREIGSLQIAALQIKKQLFKGFPAAGDFTKLSYHLTKWIVGTGLRHRYCDVLADDLPPGARSEAWI